MAWIFLCFEHSPMFETRGELFCSPGSVPQADRAQALGSGKLRIEQRYQLVLCGQPAEFAERRLGAVLARCVRGKAACRLQSRRERPNWAQVSPANVNDITVAKAMPIKPGGTYVFDLGYYDYG